jgi:hypothetical protein
MRGSSPAPAGSGRSDAGQSRLEPPPPPWTVYSGMFNGQYVTMTEAPQDGQTAFRTRAMRASLLRTVSGACGRDRRPGTQRP